MDSRNVFHVMVCGTDARQLRPLFRHTLLAYPGWREVMSHAGANDANGSRAGGFLIPVVWPCRNATCRCKGVERVSKGHLPQRGTATHPRCWKYMKLQFMHPPQVDPPVP